MTRIERARLIRDKLLFDHWGDWELIQLGDRKVAQFDRRGMNAILWNHTDLKAVGEASQSLALPRKGSCRPDPHALDLWVRGRRVLSLTWGETDQIKLDLMERGDWEADYFGLPAPRGGSQPTLH